METLAEIQKALKAPKGQVNAFGKYKYRSCEDILEAVKPLLGKWALVICDEIILIGDRYYIKAMATITNDKFSHSVSAYAREPLNKKGMDESQITGAASSYARKYALNGLFAIDDTRDADATNNGVRNEARPLKTQVVPPSQNETLNLIKKIKKDDEPSLLDFMSDKGLTGVDVLALDEKGLTQLKADLKKVFN